MSIPATPTKLKNGSWGARVESDHVAPGDVVTIRTRGGKSWEARVERVVWSGKGVSLCETSSTTASRSRSRYGGRRGKWTGCSCGSRENEYGDLISSDRNCRSCEFEAYDM